MPSIARFYLFKYSYSRSVDADKNDCDHTVEFYRFWRAFSLRGDVGPKGLVKMAQIAIFTAKSHFAWHFGL